MCNVSAINFDANPLGSIVGMLTVEGVLVPIYKSFEAPLYVYEKDSEVLGEVVLENYTAITPEGLTLESIEHRINLTPFMYGLIYLENGEYLLQTSATLLVLAFIDTETSEVKTKGEPFQLNLDFEIDREELLGEDSE